MHICPTYEISDLCKPNFDEFNCIIKLHITRQRQELHSSVQRRSVPIFLAMSTGIEFNNRRRCNAEEEKEHECM